MRGVYGTKYPLGRGVYVGALYHSVGDRADAVRQMGRDFDALYSDVTRTIGLIPYEGSGARVEAFIKDPSHVAMYAWWLAVAKPMFNAWTIFEREQIAPGGDWKEKYTAYSERFTTNWDAYEGWIKRLKTLRDSAKQLGFKLVSMEPEQLQTTIVEDVGGAAKGAAKAAVRAAKDVYDLTKIALYGGLALGGILILSGIVHSLKEREDPTDKYFSLLKRRR